MTEMTILTVSTRITREKKEREGIQSNFWEKNAIFIVSLVVRLIGFLELSSRQVVKTSGCRVVGLSPWKMKQQILVWEGRRLIKEWND